jgi:hypothetical protein
LIRSSLLLPKRNTAFKRAKNEDSKYVLFFGHRFYPISLICS